MFDVLIIDQGKLWPSALKLALMDRGIGSYTHELDLEEGLEFMEELRPKLLVIGHGHLAAENLLKVQCKLNGVGLQIPVVVLLAEGEKCPGVDSFPFIFLELPLSPLKLAAKIFEELRKS